jgi:hypothetical protein
LVGLTKDSISMISTKSPDSFSCKSIVSPCQLIAS